MKKQFLFLLLLLLSGLTYAQCYPDRHNTSWFDGWLSCETAENPNPSRDISHWITYDFGQVYTLNELKMWNVNDPDILNNGVKTLYVDYSNDGVNWDTYGEITLPMAPGISTYEGDQITHFNGLKTRYLLLTVKENHGGECSGFSELRILADSTADPNANTCIIADVYPNPFKDNFSVYLKKQCLGTVQIAIEDVTGRTVIAPSSIQLYETRTFESDQFKPGVYFVCLQAGEIKQRYKIVHY